MTESIGERFKRYMAGRRDAGLGHRDPDTPETERLWQAVTEATDNATPEPTAAARLDEIRARSKRLDVVPLETSAENYIMRDMIDSIGDVRWLLEQLAAGAAAARAEQAEAIIARVTSRMQEYDRHGSGAVNVRQVLNLLSPTWPDGNYEATPEGGNRD